MAYLTYDQSPSSGSPTELYRFVYNDQVYRFSQMDGGIRSFFLNDEEYVSESISRERTEMSENMPKTALDITVSRTFPIAQLFFMAPPEGVISITVLSLQLLDETKEYITMYKGRVINCSFIENDQAILHCEPIFSSLRRPGLRMVYESQCIHGLYQPGCNLLKDDWGRTGFVLDVDNPIIYVQEASNAPDDWYTGGFFVCGDVRRMIVSHAGVELRLLHPVLSTIKDQACLIYPGCNHLLSHCGGKFDNAVNYGGWPWLPEKNPFTGDNIFW